MKVIKNNKVLGFPRQIVCEQEIDKYGFCYGKAVDFCGSILEIDAEDIRKHPWHKYPDYKGIDYGVICPICGQFISIPSNTLSKQLQESAPEIRVS